MSAAHVSAVDLLAQDFGSFSEVIAAQARERPDHRALVEAERALSYAALDRLMDRVAAALQRDGIKPGQAVAICAATSVEYAAAFLGVVRAGGVVAPLAPSSTPRSLAMMLRDCAAPLLFLDSAVGEALAPVAGEIAAARVSLDGSEAGRPLEAWLAPAGAGPAPVQVGPEEPFNIIYSSGTTGAPKGIVQPHSYRWAQLRRGAYDSEAVTMISTPLYSNTTLVAFLPTLSNGGTAVLMQKFDAERFLRLSQRERATHAMLVPVQYRRLMERADFDDYDLSSYRAKYSTSAPFAPEIKADVLRRWPGGLVEFYGMTEGGGSCALIAHEHPDKLHTVGRPMPGHEIRLIDEAGREVAPGEAGEIVGRSGGGGGLMVGYHNQPEKTREAEWIGPTGERYIRTGDVGRFDADGFLTLIDRKKDLIISGGFNVYPSDLEAEIVRHEDVLEAAVLGVPSETWGETPVAFVVARPGRAPEPEALKRWVNARLGKTQRLADLRLVDALPRSAIGKVLKRELREAYSPAAQTR